MKTPHPYRIPLGVIILCAAAALFAFLFVARGSVESRAGISIFMGILWTIGGLIYMLPATIAALVRAENHRAIFWVNLLAGWTGFGWLAAVIWATTDQKLPPKREANNDPLALAQPQTNAAGP